MSQKMDIPIKLQVINYEDETEQLGKFYINTNERISKKQASQILEDNDIAFNQVFQVRKEDVIIQLSMEEIENARK